MKAVRGQKHLSEAKKRHERVDLMKKCLIKVAQQPQKSPIGSNKIWATTSDWKIMIFEATKVTAAFIGKNTRPKKHLFHYYSTDQRSCWVFKSVWASSNVVGIICHPGCNRVNWTSKFHPAHTLAASLLTIRTWNIFLLYINNQKLSFIFTILRTDISNSRKKPAGLDF